MKDEYLKCPQCGNLAQGLYRNKPKGERADFVCVQCLPPHMRPSNDVVHAADEIWSAIGSDSWVRRRLKERIPND